MERIDAVLLDMGGILLPEQTSYERSVADVDLLARLADLGIDDPAEFVRERARRVRAAYLALESSASQPDLERVLADAKPEARTLLLAAFRRISAPAPYDYARALVAGLARHFALGLVSNTAIPGTHHAAVLARFGVLEHFGCAVWSANFGRRKPDPAMILHVLAALRVPARRALFVGDKLRTDVAAAARAGVRSVYVRKRGAPFAGRLQPDFTLQDVRELPILLARFRSR